MFLRSDIHSNWILMSFDVITMFSGNRIWIRASSMNSHSRVCIRMRAMDRVAQWKEKKEKLLPVLRYLVLEIYCPTKVATFATKASINQLYLLRPSHPLFPGRSLRNFARSILERVKVASNGSV